KNEADDEAGAPSSPEEAVAQLKERKVKFVKGLDKRSPLFREASVAFDEGIYKVRLIESVRAVRAAVRAVDSKVKALEAKHERSAKAATPAASAVRVQALKPDSNGHGRYIDVASPSTVHRTSAHIFQTSPSAGKGKGNAHVDDIAKSSSVSATKARGQIKAKAKLTRNLPAIAAPKLGVKRARPASPQVSQQPTSGRTGPLSKRTRLMFPPIPRIEPDWTPKELFYQGMQFAASYHKQAHPEVASADAELHGYVREKLALEMDPVTGEVSEPAFYMDGTFPTGSWEWVKANGGYWGDEFEIPGASNGKGVDTTK
ncbi:hypothetical protein K505DRAFT_360555, partial [Melanomma pulvis-pyrius CBS 109.77]